ncbi:pilus assembly FimT family protein [Alkalinema pantanalense CENA528]|uniref:pilus assembly FimT family protein n=1 Tax=Alkalinema pantanalense TaxID=1620705 RepID=UPI003D6FEC07
MRYFSSWPRSNPKKQETGFTLIEMLIVLIILGIIVAIGVPSWLSFYTHWRLGVAQSEIVEGMKQAQNFAKLKKIGYQFQVRQTNQVTTEWAISPMNQEPVQWRALPQGVLIDGETTLRLKNGVYLVQFDDYGNVNGQLGRVTLSVNQDPIKKRCVIVSTLLGAIRTGSNQKTPQNGRYCY